MDFEFLVESPSQVPLVLILVNEFVAFTEILDLSDVVNDEDLLWLIPDHSVVLY